MQNIIINLSTGNDKKNNRLLFQHIVVSLNRKLMIKQSKSPYTKQFYTYPKINHYQCIYLQDSVI